MNTFYQDLITQKSWALLKKLKNQIDFVLIGGWAVYLYTKALKSKDIDIIVDFSQLSSFKQQYEIFKNDRLKKYEAKRNGVDIDIYLPYYSNLGLPVEEILRHKSKIETFTVLKLEILLVTKQKAYMERKTSIKGQKDILDIISLLFLNDFDFDFYKDTLNKYRLMNYSGELIKMLSETNELSELGINKHFFSKKKKEILPKLYDDRRF